MVKLFLSSMFQGSQFSCPAKIVGHNPKTNIKNFWIVMKSDYIVCKFYSFYYSKDCFINEIGTKAGLSIEARSRRKCAGCQTILRRLLLTSNCCKEFEIHFEENHLFLF